jgi:hypothetical protein
MSAAAVIYVDADAGGMADGTSWHDAYTDLQDALIAATAGDEIWVAAGRYVPRNLTDPNLPRGGSFSIPSGVAVYGGFAGDEATFAARAGLFDQTILSGDVNGDDGPDFANMDDNVYHVVFIKQTTEATVLDGLTVSGGYANGNGAARQRGAGLIVEDAVGLIEHVAFEGNRVFITGNNRRSVGGAGACVLSGTATFRHSTFRGNLVDSAGGPIGPIGGGGGGLAVITADTVVEDCLFESNVVSGSSDRWGGGGMGVFPNEHGTSHSVTVFGSTFSNNQILTSDGLVFGGGIAVLAVLGSIDFRVSDSEFLSNTIVATGVGATTVAPAGGGLGFSSDIQADDSLVSIGVDGCRFAYNRVESNAFSFKVAFGGGIGGSCNAGGFTLDVRDTEVTNNVVRYTDNTPGTVGGAGIGIHDTAGAMSSCTIVNTTAAYNVVRARGCQGAGMLFLPSLAGPVRLANCRIFGNQMTLVNDTSVPSGSGGGLFVRSDNVIELHNVVVVGNSARRRGGVSLHGAGSVRVSNATIASNSASEEESGIRFVTTDHPVSIDNSIVWGNRLGPALDGLGQIAGPAEWVNVNMCDVENWAGEFPGAGILSISPMFADPLGADGLPRSGDEDVRLSAVSTCIDAGDNALVPRDAADVDGDMDPNEALPVDADGNARRFDNLLVADSGLGGAPIVDLGAYEFAQRCPGDINGDDSLNMSDLGAMLAAFGADAEAPDFEPLADLRPDGAINIGDLGILLTLYGSECR